jgi:hypothetical protein
MVGLAPAQHVLEIRQSFPPHPGAIAQARLGLAHIEALVRRNMCPGKGIQRRDQRGVGTVFQQSWGEAYLEVGLDGVRELLPVCSSELKA